MIARMSPSPSRQASPSGNHLSADEYYHKLDRMLATRYVQMQLKKRAALLNPTPGNYTPR